MILAADVGGTKTQFGLFKRVDGRLRAVREAAFVSRERPSFEAIVREFLAQGNENVHRCAVGVAGPVLAGRSLVVNLRWPVDARRLARELGLARVDVINDLEAMAWGIPELPRSRLASLTPGLSAGSGNGALIAAGTGLGMALLVRDGNRLRVCPGEGGHQAFAPRSELEIDLLRHLQRRFGRVSLERVVSGPGLVAIYRFLVRSGRGRETRMMRRRLKAGDDRAAVIGAAGTAGEDRTAKRAVDLFVALYGAAAGDLALAAGATGGVWVGGGIAPRLLSRTRGGAFLRAFRAKGRLAPLMKKIPVRVILEPRTVLLGAARVAASRHSSMK